MATFLLAMSNLMVHAQSVEGTLDKTAVEVKNNELLNLMLKIKNNSGETFSVVTELKTSLNLLTKNESQNILNAGDSAFMPLKVLIPANAKAGHKYQLTVTLKTKDNRIFDRDTCTIVIQKNRLVRLFVSGNDILLRKDSNTFSIPLRLINAGNTTESVSIIASFPAAFNNYLEKIVKTELPPFTDTTVYYTKKNVKNLYRHGNFQINVSGLYKDGNVFGMGTINVQTSKSTLSYTRQQYQGQSNDNDVASGNITLSGNYLYSPFEYYQLQANNKIILAGGKSSLKFNVDATAWKRSGTRMLLRNTWLNYEQGSFGIIAGNINRNFDLNINGRGAAFYFTGKDKRGRLEAGYVNEGYNLIGDGTQSRQTPGSAYWANYDYHKKELRIKASLLQEKASFTSTQSTLLNTEVNFLTAKKNNLDLLLSAGNASDHSGEDKSKQGLALGFNYSGKMGKQTDLTSNNYFSTAAFPGQKRGFLSFDERVNRRMGKKASSWIALNYYKFNPETLPGDRNLFHNQYSRGKAALGLSLKTSLRSNLGLAVNFNEETNNFAGSTGLPGISRMQSTHLLITGNYSNSFAHASLSFNMEGGWYESNINPGKLFHSKSMLNLHYRFLSLNAMYQQGYFSIIEILNGQNKMQGDYRYYSISPELQKDFFKGRLSADLGLTFTGNTNYGSSLMLTAGLVYNLSRKTKATASYTHSHYSFGNYNQNNLTASVSQALSPIKFNSGKHYDLGLFVYMDNNKNGVYDAGDQPASGQVIRINDVMLTTSPAGKALYKNLPADSTYNIHLPATEEWYAPDQSLELQQDQSIAIPLHKMGKVSGKLTYLYDEFSYETNRNVGLITISAIDKNGKVFQTKTNDRGVYIFYLPGGTYNIMINKENLDPETECLDNEQTITVESDQAQKINFQLKAKKRKIETKKFSSASLNKTKSNKGAGE